MPEPVDVLLDLFRAALEAVEPEAATARALASAVPSPAARTWLLGLGKAAHAMTRAAAAYLKEAGLDPAGGLVAAADAVQTAVPGVEVVIGDHPLPGPGSQAAAEALESVVRSVRPGDDVWVLLSGGTTSIVGVPVRGISSDDFRAAFAALLRSGLGIHGMNRVRKRISRWGGGRLAAALSHARVRVFAISDVAGDDPASIGSGPCSPDPATADRIRAMLAAERLVDALPPSVLELLERTSRGLAPETPKPGDAVFRAVTMELIAGNRVAVDAVATEATRRGFRVRVRRKPVSGEAADCGAAIARKMISLVAEAGTGGEGGAPESPVCFVAGGETTVTLGPQPGQGGRCQELALAAAREFAELHSQRMTLLAAGTDGRDGPTDVAGAIVDNDTWEGIREAGRDPAADLEAHDSLPALEAVGALVRTGPTGTNVADVIIGLAT